MNSIEQQPKALPFNASSDYADWPAASWGRATKIAIALAIAAQLFLLVRTTAITLGTLAHDEIAYLRLAQYYLDGQWSLAISGYWGPLFSWLLALLLAFVKDPLLAGRLAMSISAPMALGASIFFFRRLDLPGWAAAIGSWAIALMSIDWAQRYVTPDLLLVSLLTITVAAMCSDDYLTNRWRPVQAGFFGGLAYLTKAIALPWAIVTQLALALLWWWARRAGGAQVGRAAGRMFATLFIIAIPWIGVLSVRYGELTFSTTATIAHATVGPASINHGNPQQHDIHRHHQALLRIEPPPRGRVTTWEDPDARHYRVWSPLENRDAFRHQLFIIAWNLRFAAEALLWMDWLHLGIASMAFAFILIPSARSTLLVQRWRWPVVALVVLVLGYAPVYAGSSRYFIPLYPIVFAASVGTLRLLTNVVVPARRARNCIAGGMLIFSFCLPAVVAVVRASRGLAESGILETSRHASALADRLRKAGLRSPIVGGAEIRGAHLGLFTAYLLDVPWYGDVLDPTVRHYVESGAGLIFVDRNSDLVEQIDSSSSAVSLDDRLFGSDAEARAFPVKVYAIRRPTTDRSRAHPE